MPGSNIVVESALDLAWSHWVALGVRGTAIPPTTAVDPEALLYFTACLAERDPRLRDEVADWWRRFGRHVSRSRLTGLAGRFGGEVTAKLESLREFVRTVSHTSGKSRLDHLDTPARSLLRLRCAFGANARAEILLEFLARRTQPDLELTAMALSEVGYSKRNIAHIAGELVMAGLLDSSKEGNRVRYRLADPAGVGRVLGPLPDSPGRWHHRLPVFAAFVDLSLRLEGRDAVVQGVEARKLFEQLEPQIAAAGATGSAPPATAETYWGVLQRWLVDNLAGDGTDRERSIPGMIAGVWVGPGQESGRPGTASSAVLPMPPGSLDDRELVCLDLAQVPTVIPKNDWTWAVLSTAATPTYAHTIGLDAGDPWRFVTRAAGESRTYTAEYAQPLPHARIAGVYGETAARRARADRPALQLRLRRVESLT